MSKHKKAKLAVLALCLTATSAIGATNVSAASEAVSIDTSTHQLSTAGGADVTNIDLTSTGTITVGGTTINSTGINAGANAISTTGTVSAGTLSIGGNTITSTTAATLNTIAGQASGITDAINATKKMSYDADSTTTSVSGNFSASNCSMRELLAA